MLGSENINRDKYIKKTNGNWEEYSKLIEEEKKYFVADEVPFWSNDAGYCNRERGRVYIYKDGQLIRITEDMFNVYDIKSYKDKYGIFYGVESNGFQKTEGKVYLIDYANYNVKPLDDSQSFVYTKIQPIDDHRVLCCRNDKSLHGEYQNEYIDIIDINTKEYTRNNKTTDTHLYDNVLTDVSYLSGWLNKIIVEDEKIYYISTQNGSSNIYYSKIGADDCINITNKSGKILDYFLQSDKIYMFAMRGLSGGEFYTCDLNTGEEKRLSNFNNELEEKYEFPEVIQCNFNNSDGILIEGWLMKPSNLNLDKKHPGVLFIHGGPGSAYGAVAMHEMFAMCAEGYCVFYCNPRGSEGRGGDFADIRRKWGTCDYKDLMDFMDYIIKTYRYIDINNLGVTGGSYGGIMTNWIIGVSGKLNPADFGN